MTSIITTSEVLTVAHRFLGIPDDGSVGQSYIAAALRRLAGSVCPCSPKTLLRAMIESHRGLVDDIEDFGQQVDDAINDLIAAGDLLELDDVAAIDELIRGTWVFAAPPSFVMHFGDIAHIVGLSADDQTPLPAAVRDRVRVEGVVRRIYPEAGEDLRPLLRSLGLREISSDVWLRFPKAVQARDLVDRAERKLSDLGRSGELDGAQIFDHLTHRRTYRSRWSSLKSQSGRFIMRRPQAYGADRWGYGEVSNGEVLKLLEFPETTDRRRRGCDVAWRLALALRSLSGSDVTYNCTTVADAGHFDFFFPIPDWAKRSMMLAGLQVEPRNCLLSFDITMSQVPAAQQFLKNYLFLTPSSSNR